MPTTANRLTQSHCSGEDLAGDSACQVACSAAMPLTTPRSNLLAVLACAWAITPSVRAGDGLRGEFEKIYTTWRTAILEKDAQTWAKVTSTLAKRTIRNTIVSQRREFPKAFFESPVRPPSIKGLTFLGADAVGVTAQAVYHGKIDFGLTKQGEVDLPSNMLVLLFIKEGTDWKFDRTRMVNLGGLPDVKRSIEKGDYSFLKEDRFTPPGVTPPLPKE